MRHLPLLLILAACTGTAKDADDTDVPSDTDAPETDLVETGDTAASDSDEPPVVEWPTSPDGYVATAVAYLPYFEIPVVPLGQAPTCCRDWGPMSRNGDKLDNALASLQGIFGSQLDLQGQLEFAMESGLFVAMLDHVNLPASGDGRFGLAFLLGAFEGETTYDTASAGQGSFEILPQSFVPPTGTPVAAFTDATLQRGRVVATGGSFSIPMALVGATLDVPVKDVTVEAGLQTRTSGIALSQGKLSGYITVQDFFGAYNGVVDQACGCAGLTGPLFTQKAGGAWSGACQAMDDVLDACWMPDEYACPFLVGRELNRNGFCGTIPLIATLADLDVDGDGKYDALSLGLRFEGVPGTIVGLAE